MTFRLHFYRHEAIFTEKRYFFCLTTATIHLTTVKHATGMEFTQNIGFQLSERDEKIERWKDINRSVEKRNFYKQKSKTHFVRDTVNFLLSFCCVKATHTHWVCYHQNGEKKKKSHFLWKWTEFHFINRKYCRRFKMSKSSWNRNRFIRRCHNVNRFSNDSNPHNISSMCFHINEMATFR